MKTIEDVKGLRNRYRVHRNSVASNVLGLVVGDAEKKLIAGETPDIAAIAKKLIQSNNEVLTQTFDKDISTKLLQENDVLNQLIPPQMSEEEIRQALETSGASNVGQFMKYMKENHTGQYDGQFASLIAKSVF